MVDVLVFSKDRAAQLDLLLRSIKRFAPRFYRSVTVLYAYSEPCYREGYERLLYPLRRNLLFVHQRDFEQQVRHWLDHSDGPVSFLCDDDVFYAPAPPAGELRLPWSLRGGDYDYPFSLDGNVYRPEWIRRLLARFSFANSCTPSDGIRESTLTRFSGTPTRQGRSPLTASKGRTCRCSWPRASSCVGFANEKRASNRRIHSGR